MPEPDFILEISGLDDPSQTQPAVGSASRPWVGIRFDCCGVYTRVYRNVDGTAYDGYCPRCLRNVHLRVGPEGVNTRFFRAE